MALFTCTIFFTLARICTKSSTTDNLLYFWLNIYTQKLELYHAVSRGRKQVRVLEVIFIVDVYEL